MSDEFYNIDNFDEPNDGDYDDLDEPLGDDPDPPQATGTLEERRRVHEAFEVFERNSGDNRAPYTILNGKRVHDLGVCRHTDVQQIVGEWIWAQIIQKNHDVMACPIHVFRNSKLRYVYTAKSIDKNDEFTVVVCEKVTVPAGMIQEALLEDTPIGFKFFNKTSEDLREGL